MFNISLSDEQCKKIIFLHYAHYLMFISKYIINLFLLNFHNFLDDILKQFTIIGSLKEQQEQLQKEHRYFP